MSDEDSVTDPEAEFYGETAGDEDGSEEPEERADDGTAGGAAESDPGTEDGDAEAADDERESETGDDDPEGETVDDTETAVDDAGDAEAEGGETDAEESDDTETETEADTEESDDAEGGEEPEVEHGDEGVEDESSDDGAVDGADTGGESADGTEGTDTGEPAEPAGDGTDGDAEVEAEPDDDETASDGADDTDTREPVEATAEGAASDAATAGATEAGDESRERPRAEPSAGMLTGGAAEGATVSVTDPDAEFYTDPLVEERTVEAPPDADAAGVDEASLDEAARALWRGELVVYPTETVYGLAADALDERTVERVFETKGRDRSEPVSIAVPDVTTALEYAAPTTRTRRFMRAFLPGPVTVVCERRPSVPDAVTAGRDRVGVRIPDEPTAIALLRRVAPLTATSANHSGGENVRRTADLDPAVGEAVGVVLDGGETPGGESTVVDVAADEVIRPGERVEVVREWLEEH